MDLVDGVAVAGSVPFSTSHRDDGAGRMRLWDGPLCRIMRASRRTLCGAATSRAGVTESVDVAVSNTAAARHGDSTSPPGTKNTCIRLSQATSHTGWMKKAVSAQACLRGRGL